MEKMENLTTANANANAYNINHLVVDNTNNAHHMIDVSMDDPYPYDPDDDNVYARILAHVIDVITTTVDYPDDVSVITVVADGTVIDTYDVPAYPGGDDDYDDMITAITNMVYGVVITAATMEEK